MLASFPFTFLVLRTINESNYDKEDVVYVSDLGDAKVGEASDSKTQETVQDSPRGEKTADLL